MGNGDVAKHWEAGWEGKVAGKGRGWGLVSPFSWGEAEVRSCRLRTFPFQKGNGLGRGSCLGLMLYSS